MLVADKVPRAMARLALLLLMSVSCCFILAGISFFIDILLCFVVSMVLPHVE